MSLITLKPLDDGQKAVEIPKGKTVIGRGPFLGCSDKKVSRNHAVLEVTTKDEVYLTPTHVNPCFYQPTADSPGQILKKDVPCKLENGDSFSLLPRAYRYQLNIENGTPSTQQNDNNKSEEQCAGKTNGSTVDHFNDGTAEEFGDTIVSEKAFFKEDTLEKNCTAAKEENTFSKKIAEIKENNESNSCTKNSDESQKDVPPSTTAAEVEKPSPHDDGDDEKKKEDEEEEKEDDDDEQKLDDDASDKVTTNDPPKEKEVEIPEEKTPADKPVSDHSEGEEEEAAEEEEKEEPSKDPPPPPPPPVPSTKTTKKQTESFTKRREKQATAKRKTAVESAAPKGRRKVPKTKFSDDGVEGSSRQPGRTSSRTHRQTRQGLSLEDFVVSDDDEWQSDQSEPKQRRRKRGKRKGGDDSGSDWEVDHKKPKKASSLLPKGWSGSESGSERNSPKKKKGPRGRRKKAKSSDEVNETLSEEDEPQPSSSVTVKINKTRTSCTFGKKCFRRNASHKEQFSHPGDPDYTSETDTKKAAISESDGESSPPKKECPYGANCFRKNPQHKKDFKHTKNVRPQREAAKQADEKSKNSRNSDDYDINESFLNDDSDEYKPVDSGSDYESGGQKTKKLTKVKGGSRRGKKL